MDFLSAHVRIGVRIRENLKKEKKKPLAYARIAGCVFILFYGKRGFVLHGGKEKNKKKKIEISLKYTALVKHDKLHNIILF